MLIFEDDTAEETHPQLDAADLCQIHDLPRYVFTLLVGVLFVCAVMVNLSALYVNTRRKLRPFFRACLISMSISDLIYCVVFTATNMAFFVAKYLEYWILGPLLCYLVPFFNTTTVLCSSFMLVAIALDRYMSIRRAAVGIWNPGLRFCSLIIAMIWLASMAVATPLFFIYKPIHVLVLLPSGEVEVVMMCVGTRSEVGCYNSVALSLVFVPCIVAFLFLHVTIARRLWQRRYQQQQQQAQQLLRFVHPLAKRDTSNAMMSVFSVAACFEAPVAQWQVQSVWQEGKLSPAAAARVARHRRMVRMVLLMMGSFICLRLPAWIFLTMRVYGSFSSPVSWIFYFSFGLLNLTSCNVNPLFYTFMPQTQRVLSQLKRALLWLLCCGHISQLEPDTSMPQESAKQSKSAFCFGSQFTWRCQLKAQQAAAEAKKPVSIIDLPSTARSRRASDLKDFGQLNGRSLQATASMKSSR